jgi:predicted RNase H-like HicB family nuclease
MPTFALYLESGPRRRKTMAHVLDLLGCTAQGPTTEEALAATPAAIRAFLAFIQRRGEDVDPAAPFDTVVAAHVTEGYWLGNGDPTPGFAPDFDPLDAADLARYRARLAGMRAAVHALVGPLTSAQLRAAPEGPGRTLYAILAHAAAGSAYLRYAVGRVDGLGEAVRAVEAQPEDIVAALEPCWRITDARLAALREAERTRLGPHGQVTWSARRCLRRTLEHEWEHLVEIAARLEQPLP